MGTCMIMTTMGLNIFLEDMILFCWPRPEQPQLLLVQYYNLQHILRVKEEEERQHILKGKDLPMVILQVRKKEDTLVTTTVATRRNTQKNINLYKAL